MLEEVGDEVFTKETVFGFRFSVVRVCVCGWWVAVSVFSVLTAIPDTVSPYPCTVLSNGIGSSHATCNSSMNNQSTGTKIWGSIFQLRKNLGVRHGAPC